MKNIKNTLKNNYKKILAWIKENFIWAFLIGLSVLALIVLLLTFISRNFALIISFIIMIGAWLANRECNKPIPYVDQSVMEEGVKSTLKRISGTRLPNLTLAHSEIKSSDADCFIKLFCIKTSADVEDIEMFEDFFNLELGPWINDNYIRLCSAGTTFHALNFWQESPFVYVAIGVAFNERGLAKLVSRPSSRLDDEPHTIYDDKF